jgi:PiT family inorganic phosphate transporter
MYQVSDAITKLDKKSKFANKGEDKSATKYAKDLDKITKYIPTWVKVAVALALGLGTMIGWKRIVVTVGEKIGKEHLTYAQGASAELVAMCTIGLATSFGLPVSTTHVLSSGIAGTMAANGSGLQKGTLRNIVLAWILTLPVCVLLGATTFAGGIYIILHVLHVH